MNRAGLLFLAYLVAAGSMVAQVGSLPVQLPLNPLALCHPEQFLVTKELTFQQRTCWYSSKFLSPWVSLRAGFTSAVGQLENNPYRRAQDGDDYASRFAFYYARRGARETAEMFTGYVHHEDPRPRLSGEADYKKRVRTALLSVLLTPEDEGHSRLALAPIAGSVASAFVGMGCFRPSDSTRYVAEQFAVSYSGYFGRAIYQEFRPDISFLAIRAWHKIHPN